MAWLIAIKLYRRWWRLKEWMGRWAPLETPLLRRIWGCGVKCLKEVRRAWGHVWGRGKTLACRIQTSAWGTSSFTGAAPQSITGQALSTRRIRHTTLRAPSSTLSKASRTPSGPRNFWTGTNNTNGFATNWASDAPLYRTSLGFACSTPSCRSGTSHGSLTRERSRAGWIHVSPPFRVWTGAAYALTHSGTLSSTRAPAAA